MRIHHHHHLHHHHGLWQLHHHHHRHHHHSSILQQIINPISRQVIHQYLRSEQPHYSRVINEETASSTTDHDIRCPGSLIFLGVILCGAGVYVSFVIGYEVGLLVFVASFVCCIAGCAMMMPGESRSNVSQKCSSLS